MKRQSNLARILRNTKIIIFISVVPEKRYEILEHLPAYGPIPVYISRDADSFFSEGFVIRFYKTDGTDWTANFMPGWNKFNIVQDLSDDKILIIAGGTCYIMNPNETVPLSTFGVCYENLLTGSNEKIILQNLVDLTIIEKDGTHWDSVRISWDGLKDLFIESDEVKGLAYDPTDSFNEWKTFSYNVNSKKLIGGSY